MGTHSSPVNSEHSSKMASSKFIGCRQLEFTLSIVICVLNAIVFALAFANHYTWDNGNGKPWTWELSGAIATFGTSGFWFALENRPSVCRKFWAIDQFNLLRSHFRTSESCHSF